MHRRNVIGPLVQRSKHIRQDSEKLNGLVCNHCEEVVACPVDPACQRMSRQLVGKQKWENGNNAKHKQYNTRQNPLQVPTARFQPEHS